MAEEQLVAGAGWVSDDSSFYGSESEQERQQSLCDNFNPRSFWLTNQQDLNVAQHIAKKRKIEIQMALPDPSSHASSHKETTSASLVTASKPFSMSGTDRQAMERERLARQSKMKRKASPEPQPQLELFNFREGSHDAWQLGETASNFINRLPPDTTTTLTCPWIWVENPHRDVRSHCTHPDIEHFSDRGMDLLEQSLSNRQKIQANAAGSPKGMLTRQLIQESKQLQQRITELAVADHVLSGKWMLFPKTAVVNRVWKQVVQGVIDNRLGCTAKVATDNGNDERLICIYTKDFRDVEDISRVLAELETLGLLTAGRTIYYKHDAYTYLDIRSATAGQYGLQASLHNSRSLMLAGKLPKPSTGPQKKQSSLNKYF